MEKPRYTGRQVWNRTGTTHCPGTARRAGGTGRRTDSGAWVVSNAPAHAALVDEATFRSVQGIRTARRSGDGGARTYLLARLVVCGAGGRGSHRAHNRPGYRYRHGRTSARAEAPGLKSVFVREEHLLAGLRSRLPEVTGGDEDLVDHVRANGLVIVYLGPDWMLPVGGIPVRGIHLHVRQVSTAVFALSMCRRVRGASGVGLSACCGQRCRPVARRARCGVGGGARVRLFGWLCGGCRHGGGVPAFQG
ncbi:hypothetical protein [Saccharopolyspora mangrovi]|uniref:hypothetical protein n=1 Tax=Saccharopolyspora mangrovi TaxID=3082379 RepID=UPI00389A7809